MAEFGLPEEVVLAIFDLEYRYSRSNMGNTRWCCPRTRRVCRQYKVVLPMSGESLRAIQRGVAHVRGEFAGRTRLFDRTTRQSGPWHSRVCRQNSAGWPRVGRDGRWVRGGGAGRWRKYFAGWRYFLSFPLSRHAWHDARLRPRRRPLHAGLQQQRKFTSAGDARPAQHAAQSAHAGLKAWGGPAVRAPAG